jgi:hypothetical protein
MIYNYKCQNCGDTFELVVKLADRLVAIESYCSECCEVGYIEQVLGMPMIIDQHKLMNAKKPDGEFRERMQKIHESTAGSTLNQSNYF